MATDRIRFAIEVTPPRLYHCEVCGFTSVYKSLYIDTETGMRCLPDYDHGLPMRAECGHVLEDIPVTVTYARATHMFCTLECAITALQAVLDN
jgi:hypothetical protein